jgi:hypothetical protein
LPILHTFEKNFSMKKIYISLLLTGLVAGAQAQTNVLSENFDDLTVLFSSGGWSQVNNSNPLGLEIWHNGTGVGIPAYNGGATSFAEAGFNSTSATGTGNISTWMITPPMMLNNGDIITFVTTSYNNRVYPDRLELRMNPLNTVNVGSTDTSVGDFSVLLHSVNPNLVADTSYYPQGYWGWRTATVSGLAGATTCRLAFRYWVTNGGGAGLNSSTIGIDAFNVSTLVGIPELPAFRTLLYPNPAKDHLLLGWSEPMKENTTASIYNGMGQLVATRSLARGIQQATLDISSLTPGMYTIVINGNLGTSRSGFIKQ